MIVPQVLDAMAIDLRKSPQRDGSPCFRIKVSYRRLK